MTITDQSKYSNYKVLKIVNFSEAGHENNCVPLRLPICSGTMPWALTAFPNFVNNNNMDELSESLKYFQVKLLLLLAIRSKTI